MSHFFLAYEEHFEDALSEIQAGAKTTCWAWFMWPTPIRTRSRTKRPTSAQSVAYALTNQTAWDFVNSNYLCPRWLRLLKAVASQLRAGIPSRTLYGEDFPRLLASLKFFHKLFSGRNNHGTWGNTRAARLVLESSRIQHKAAPQFEHIADIIESYGGQQLGVTSSRPEPIAATSGQPPSHRGRVQLDSSAAGPPVAPGSRPQGNDVTGAITGSALAHCPEPSRSPAVDLLATCPKVQLVSLLNMLSTPHTAPTALPAPPIDDHALPPTAPPFSSSSIADADEEARLDARSLDGKVDISTYVLEVAPDMSYFSADYMASHLSTCFVYGDRAAPRGYEILPKREQSEATFHPDIPLARLCRRLPNTLPMPIINFDGSKFRDDDQASRKTLLSTAARRIIKRGRSYRIDRVVLPPDPGSRSASVRETSARAAGHPGRVSGKLPTSVGSALSRSYNATAPKTAAAMFAHLTNIVRGGSNFRPKKDVEAVTSTWHSADDSLHVTAKSRDFIELGALACSDCPSPGRDDAYQSLREDSSSDEEDPPGHFFHPGDLTSPGDPAGPSSPSAIRLPPASVLSDSDKAHTSVLLTNDLGPSPGRPPDGPAEPPDPAPAPVEFDPAEGAFAEARLLNLDGTPCPQFDSFSILIDEGSTGLTGACTGFIDIRIGLALGFRLETSVRYRIATAGPDAGNTHRAFGKVRRR